jgi:hypothetical protein
MRRVPETTDVIIIQADGTLRVAGHGAERRLRDRAGSYRIVSDVPGLLLLQREDGAAPGVRVLMAGQVLHRMTVMEIINLIATANWRGELHVIGPDAERTLTFDGAALKNAQSTHPSDRLGEVLYRKGVLDRSQLDGLLRDVTPERRFGHMLVEHGLVSQEDLFKHLQTQAEQIFFNALLVSSGHYIFAVPDDDRGDAASPATLHIPVQHLLMEGVQRVDEMGLFRERIPSGQMCPEVKPDARSRSLEPAALSVLSRCDGQRTIDDIARESGLGEFQTTKAIYHLLQQGQVVLRSGARLEPDKVRWLLDPINDVMRDIFMAAATYGGLGRTQAAVTQWLQSNGLQKFLGDAVEEDGSLEVDKVVAAMGAVESERPLEDLHQALQQLAGYALFTVTSQLNRDQEMSLARDVNRRLKAIRVA